MVGAEFSGYKLAVGLLKIVEIPILANWHTISIPS